ncbi:tetratricopeptide repeat protein [Micromonospora sp. NPDC126480]|uniref:tetratricopeptide repeat protein n=1 Tax=Micromonospora sp. NPDC126480 TaxID=3155312 RepID=UPI0033188C54
MTGPPARRSRRPRRLSLLLAVGGVLGGTVSAVLGNVTGNLLSELSVTQLGSASAAVIVLGLAAAVVVEWRRYQRDQAAAPEPEESAPAVGAPTLPWPAGLTGRADDVAAVVDALRHEHAVAVVGRRAVGTSSCAVQAANLCREDFPDGCYYLDLRRRGRPRSAYHVLTALARILNTRAPASGRPDDLVEAADGLRGKLDGQRVLLVLDNVDDPAQVRALLPPTARTCRLLFAGTGALEAQEGVTAHRLFEPGPDDAVDIFAAAGAAAPVARPHRPDPRTDPAVRTVVELCGRQPRTVAELGRRTAQHGWRHADVLDALRRAVETAPHQQVAASPATLLVTARDTAYHALSAEARRLWRLMSLSPAPLDRPAIAALAARRPDRVAPLLHELATGGFVTGAEGDRYEVRPLLAPYARLHLRAGGSARRRVTAQTRLTRHLARRAERHAANLVVAAATLDRDRTLSLDDDPYGWFDLHQELLLAVVRVPAGAVESLPRRVRRWWFRLAVALCGWLAHVERLAEWEEVCRTVLATPTAGDRPEIAGWAHNELGVLRRRRHDPQGAATALSLAVAERSRRGIAQARMNLGLVLLDLGQLDDAVEHLELSRRHRSGADRAGHALTDLGLGAARLARGEFEVAHHHLVRAANTFRSLGDARGYAAALTNLVLVHAELGEHLDAAQAWRAALREYGAVTDATNRAVALLNAGATLLASAPGQARQAYEMLAESRRLREGGQPTAGLGRTLLYLGDAADVLGDADEARRHWVDAAAVCEAAGDGDGQAAADARLGGEDGAPPAPTPRTPSTGVPRDARPAPGATG